MQQSDRAKAVDERFGEIQLFTLCNRGVPRPFAMLDALPRVEEHTLARGRENPRDWWIVTITGLEVVRVQDGPLAPLTQAQIIQNTNARRHSLLRARIGWGEAGRGHEIDVDIGSGVRIGIESCRVDVRILGPAMRTKEVAANSRITLGDPGVGGLFTDSIITTHITPSHGPPSARWPTLTQVISIAAGVANRSVSIPPFAKRVTISRALVDVFGTLSFTVGLEGPSVRDFTFSPDDLGATVRLIIPQVATHINFGALAPGERALTLVWELDI